MVRSRDDAALRRLWGGALIVTMVGAATTFLVFTDRGRKMLQYIWEVCLEH
jgi:hypothetical protein